MGKKGSAGKTQSIRFPQWMADALDEIAEKKSATVTDVVIEFVRCELEKMDITMGIGRNFGKTNESVPNDRAKKGA
jgi:hypothetical protein